MELDYLLLDVFTDEGLKGNPLAVVPVAKGLSDERMQAIAKEFNLSETVFFFPAEDAAHTAAVRIFTPHQELPFAGHPTVGAAVVLGMQHNTAAVYIEEKVGLVPARVEKRGERAGYARFTLPKLSEREAELGNAAGIAAALGLSVDEIGCGPYQPALYSAGVPFHLVPVKGAAALKKISLDRSNWDSVFPGPRHSAYVFTLTPDEPDNDFAARMFGMGLGEDPGTGSAAAALIGLLAEHVDFADGEAEFVLRQGLEMGRLCRIGVSLRKENGALVEGAIAGDAVIVGEGRLYLPD